MPYPADILKRIDDLLLDPDQRHVEPRVGQVGHCRMFRQLESIDRNARTIDFVCSTGTVDRYGEIVEPMAFAESLDAFMLNPVFPAGHAYEFNDGRSPTVGHWKSMKATKQGLIGKAWFKPRGLGEECWLDYLDGNLTSVSVGFLTRAWEMRELKIGGETRRVRVFTKVDLLEVSAVLIPANPQARIRSGLAALDHSPTLQRLEALLARLESTRTADHADDIDTLDQDDAEAWLDPCGFRADAYFGDIPDDDGTPPRHSESMGDDPQLKAMLADALDAAKAGHAHA